MQSAVLRADLVAGITVALVLIPRSMAYAQLPGLPPYYGLYAASLPGIIAARCSRSNQFDQRRTTHHCWSNKFDPTVPGLYTFVQQIPHTVPESLAALLEFGDGPVRRAHGIVTGTGTVTEGR